MSNAFLRGASLGESVGLNLGKDDGKLGQDDFLAAQLATLTESATDTSSAAPRQRKRKARQLAKSKASKKQSMMSKLLFGSSAVEDVETDLADLSAITKVMLGPPNRNRNPNFSPNLDFIVNPNSSPNPNLKP